MKITGLGTPFYILGAIHGVKSIPQNWLEPLDLREVIDELAKDQFSYKTWGIGDYSQNQEVAAQITTKYPGW